MNRDGLRVNTAQIIALWPILITLRDYECNSIEDLTTNMVKHFKNSCMLDVSNLQLSQHFSLALWEGHKKHWKLINIKSKTRVMYSSGNNNFELKASIDLIYQSHFWWLLSTLVVV